MLWSWSCLGLAWLLPLICARQQRRKNSRTNNNYNTENKTHRLSCRPAAVTRSWMNVKGTKNIYRRNVSAHTLMRKRAQNLHQQSASMSKSKWELRIETIDQTQQSQQQAQQHNSNSNFNGSSSGRGSFQKILKNHQDFPLTFKRPYE